MENKKVTKAQRNEDIIALLRGNPVKYGTTITEAVEHLEHENELLASRKTSQNGKPRKPDKKKIATMGYQENVLDYLAEKPDLLVSTSDIIDVLREMFPDEKWSNQRVASILNGIADSYDSDGNLKEERQLFKNQGKGKVCTTYQIKPEVAEERKPMPADEDEADEYEDEANEYEDEGEANEDEYEDEDEEE